MFGLQCYLCVINNLLFLGEGGLENRQVLKRADAEAGGFWL